MKYKICVDCGKEFPATTEHFYRMKKIYLQSYCKGCCSIRNTTYYADHVEKSKQAAREWAKKNPEKVKVALQRWYRRNTDRVKRATKLWAIANKVKVSGYKQNWEIRNRLTVREAKRKWRKNNPDKALTKARLHRRNNPEKYRMYAQKRVTLQKSLPYSKIHIEELLAWFNYECAYCDTPLTKYHLDHFIPLTSPNCPGTVPSNIVPACPSCNSSKGNKNPLEWLKIKRGEVMGQIRYDTIMEYLVRF